MKSDLLDQTPRFVAQVRLRHVPGGGIPWQVREVVSGTCAPIRDFPVELTKQSERFRIWVKARTRKFPDIRDWDHARPSVQRLMPLSSTLKMNTAPLLIIVLRSKSFSRRVTRGINPRRAA